jgi:hypothetical protein
MNVVAAGNVSSTTMRAFDAPAMSRILATVPSLEEEPAPRKSAKKAATKRG